MNDLASYALLAAILAAIVGGWFMLRRFNIPAGGYLGLAVMLLGAAVGWILLRRKPSDDLPRIKTELDVVHAQARADKLEAEYGRKIAVAKIETEHKAAIQQLEQAEIEEASRLRNDPRALSAFLVRAGARKTS